MEKKTARRLILFTCIALCVICATVALLWISRAQKKIVKINDAIFYVDVAADDAERARGLQGRDSLAHNEGMLFVFQTPERYVFWMKDVRFDLDIIWIRDGRIIDLTRHARAADSSTPDDELERFIPAENVDSVLEVSAGTIDTYTFMIGDRVVVE
ncbi:MAG: DUF192 domain-containing protein [Candidatus Kerfeldbacteria bacterium]|nr:DUF192 domain-containing protein [Candidatus Kerfeldbacteria bacterium]